MNTFCGTVGREIGLQNISCENHFSRRRQWENHELAPEANLEKKKLTACLHYFERRVSLADQPKPSVASSGTNLPL